MSYGTKAANEALRHSGIVSVDTGTAERGRHSGGVIVATRTITEGGIETSVGTQAAFECALDVLLGKKPAAGALAGTQGSRDDRAAVARSRYEAGMKLRRIFIDAALVGVKAFDPSGARGGGGDISDAQMVARRKYNDLMRELGGRATIVSGPCCYDQLPNNERWLNNVRTCLDALCLVVM